MTSSDSASTVVGVVPTGAANIASVRAALERAGARTRLITDAREMKASAAVVLPGVGAFAQAMGSLTTNGLDTALRERIVQGMPTLCICLGLQLLCRESEESPGVRGLGVIDDAVLHFDSGSIAVPQLGWNRIEAEPGCVMLESGPFYFANSFRLPQIPHGWRGATADYGGSFVAGLERDGVLACQFHPELSGTLGKRLLGRWLQGIRECTPC